MGFNGILVYIDGIQWEMKLIEWEINDIFMGLNGMLIGY
jgi:hypothetical protein